MAKPKVSHSFHIATTWPQWISTKRFFHELIRKRKRFLVALLLISVFELFYDFSWWSNCGMNMGIFGGVHNSFCPLTVPKIMFRSYGRNSPRAAEERYVRRVIPSRKAPKSALRWGRVTISCLFEPNWSACDASSSGSFSSRFVSFAPGALALKSTPRKVNLRNVFVVLRVSGCLWGLVW